MKIYRYEYSKGLGCKAYNKKEAAHVIRDLLHAKYGVKKTLQYIADRLARY